MIRFGKLCLEHVNLLRTLLQQNKTRLCDYTIGGLFMWRDFFDASYAVKNGTLFLKYCIDKAKNKTAFSFPLGGDVKLAMSIIFDFCKSNKIPTILCTVSESELNFLKENFRIRTIKSERDWFDYLYKIDDIAFLQGRKYNSQRNHVNKFARLFPQYTFNTIKTDNLRSIAEFMHCFYAKKFIVNPIEEEEKNKVFEVVSNFDEYGLIGGFIRAGERIFAVSIGEVVNDTLFVHIEKADTTIHGSYQVITKEFAKLFVGTEVIYINREEDVGDLGLREAKILYNPLRMLEKYTVELEMDANV